MRIALTDSYPNWPFCAEREFAYRFTQVAQAAGHTVAEVKTSDEIYACAPDFVLALSEFTPKLTRFPTFGAMWSPPAFFKDDPYRVRAIRSYDAYLVGSDPVRDYLKDLEFPTGVAKPKSDFPFLPVAPERPFVPREGRSLAYLGVNWDGSRHGTIIDKLIEWKLITVYGPRWSWSRLKSGFGGELPFDGHSVNATLSAHGIALCIHKDRHRTADTPSARLFEAAAAGCVIIADEIPFARRVLGDAALYVDLRKPSMTVARTIANHVAWVVKNPERASAMAARSHERLNREYSMEELVRKTCDFAQGLALLTEETRDQVRSHYAAVSHSPRPVKFGGGEGKLDRAEQMPLVDVIVRCGSRSLEYVKRAVDSLEAQNIGPLRALLVDHGDRADISRFTTGASYKNVQPIYIRSENNGLRSSALWAGLANVTSPFFALLDDDDDLMPDHFFKLLYASVNNPKASFIYGGTIKVEEDDGYYHHAPNFRPSPGGREERIPERRELKFLEEFSIFRLISGDNFICSNSWIARSELLDKRLLADPRLEYAEDLYLYMLLATRADIVCSHQVTAHWNLRSSTRDNAMFAVHSEALQHNRNRVWLRLRNERLRGGLTLQELLDLLNSVQKNRKATQKRAEWKQLRSLRKLLHSIPAYQAYRERRGQRRREKAKANGQFTT
jgi:glycosyltransferase involved in cell wall biosynthesis